MVSAKAAVLLFGPLLETNGIFYVFPFSDSASNCASVEGCVDVVSSVGMEVVTEICESQH